MTSHHSSISVTPLESNMAWVLALDPASEVPGDGVWRGIDGSTGPNVSPGESSEENTRSRIIIPGTAV